MTRRGYHCEALSIIPGGRHGDQRCSGCIVGEGGAEKNKSQQAQGGARNMRVFPAVAQLRPFGHMVWLICLAKAEKARSKALELEILEPEPVDRMDEKPIDGMHDDEREKRRQNQPECHAVPGNKEEEDDGCCP